MKCSTEPVLRIAFPRPIIIFFLSLVLLVPPGVGQASEKDCQKATMLYLEAKALLEFFMPYAHGFSQFDGPAMAMDEELTRPARQSMQTAADWHLERCKNGGSETCEDYKRVREAYYDGNSPSDPDGGEMTTNVQSCNIYYRETPDSPRREVVFDGPLPNTVDAMEWSSMLEHERVHQSACQAMNGGRKYPETVEVISGDAANLSPYYLEMKDPAFLAWEEVKAYQRTMDVLSEYLEENCFDENVKFTGPALREKCGQEGGAEGMGKLERELPDGASSSPRGPAAPAHPSSSLEPQTYRLRSVKPEKVVVQEDPIELSPGESKEVPVTGSCACCFNDSDTVAVRIYGGPEQSILIGVAEPGVGVSCTSSTDCGSSSGDPHICTHDQLMYDFQGVGEFVLTKTEGFEVQARFKPWNINRLLSVNSALAARFGDDRIAFYSGTPVKMTINGKEVPLNIGDSFTLPGGLFIRRDKDWYRFSKGDYVVEASPGSDRIGTILVRVPEKSDAVGLLGNRNGDRADDLRMPGGGSLSMPTKHEELYGKFGNAWRVTAETSLFDYAEGESPETFADLKYPERATSIRNVSADARKKAEEICRKAGVTNAINLENCIFDVGMTGDETFAQDAAAAAEPLARLETTDGPAAPDVARRSTADGVTLEIPSVLMASFPVEVKITGPIRGEGHQIRTIPAGGGPNARATNPGSSFNLSGGERSITLAAPYPPGNYELVYLSPGGRNILLSVPFRVIAPKAEIFAPDTVELGQTVEIRIVGDISPNTLINIVPVGSPVTAIRDHNFLNGGTEVTTRVVLLHATTPGEYEIRYMSGVVYARKPLTIK